MTDEEKTVLRVSCVHAAATLEAYPGKVHDWAHIAKVAATLYNNVVNEMGLESRNAGPAQTAVSVVTS